MLAAQDVGDDRRNAAHNETLGVDQHPFLFDRRGVRRYSRLGQRLHGTLLDRYGPEHECPETGAPPIPSGRSGSSERANGAGQEESQALRGFADGYYGTFDFNTRVPTRAPAHPTTCGPPRRPGPITT